MFFQDEAKKDPPPVPQMAPNTMQPLQITVNYNAPFYMSQGGFPVMQQHDNLLMKIPGLAAASTNTTNEANIAVQANMAAEELQRLENFEYMIRKKMLLLGLIKQNIYTCVRLLSLMQLKGWFSVSPKSHHHTKLAFVKKIKND